MRTLDIATLLGQEREHIEEALKVNLPDQGEYPSRIHEAIRYSALGGGKRLRPIISLASVDALGLNRSAVVKAACSIEYVHCCSLVLDDLPSMDNAATRRGRPTTHRVFGVATGILAADALLMHAFKLVADNGVELGAQGPQIARAVRDLATAVGSYGMVGGQHVDLEASGRGATDKETLDYIQTRKTGALFVVAATIGGTLLGADSDELGRIGRFARDLGIAYQIVDDLLDWEGDPDVMGKDVGMDRGKVTFVTVYGTDVAKQTAERLVSDAVSSLSGLHGDTTLLRELAAYCLDRAS
ncbi:MAG: polyprenyl synthetase family protein [Candidatus Eisenbacteria bacterium]|nr:polyprenyl synthetase family protein [Candidatus Eisenbacteria bacterium]